MMGEFERAARDANIRRFAEWQRTYHPPQEEFSEVEWDALAEGFTTGEIKDANEYADALDRPTLAILDTVKDLVRTKVLELMDTRTDQDGLTAHDRKMFSDLNVKY